MGERKSYLMRSADLTCCGASQVGFVEKRFTSDSQLQLFIVLIKGKETVLFHASGFLLADSESAVTK